MWVRDVSRFGSYVCQGMVTKHCTAFTAMSGSATESYGRYEGICTPAWCLLVQLEGLEDRGMPANACP